MSSTAPAKVHMKLKFSGAQNKVALFNFIAGMMDPDWPLGPKHLRREPEVNLHCAECGGFVYKNPNMDPEDIKLLAKQVNDNQRFAGSLKVKVKKFTKAPKCSEVPDDPDEEETSTALVVLPAN